MTFKLNIPEGAIRITHFLKLGDHPNVLEDYVSGHCGDIDLDEYFIPIQNNKSIHVERGDWIFDMADGSYIIKHNEPITL
jgi:hypothetical protein